MANFDGSHVFAGPILFADVQMCCDRRHRCFAIPGLSWGGEISSMALRSFYRTILIPVLLYCNLVGPRVVFSQKQPASQQAGSTTWRAPAGVKPEDYV